MANYEKCEKNVVLEQFWACTPNKKVVCGDISQNYTAPTKPLETADESVTISFTQFEKQVTHDSKGKVVLTKQGKPAKRLVPVKQQVNSTYLVNFMVDMLPNIIHHRNMLKLFRNLKGMFLDAMQCAYIDIDYSENLTIGIKWEPQSMHWSKQQVTVHSGIFKYNAEKVFHPYISDSRIHDQVFVKQVLEEIIAVSDIPDGVKLVLESDNCSGQYKSCQHFFHLQLMANSLNRIVIRLWGIEGHGKGEVDHVGGIAKVAARTSIAGGTVFQNSLEIVEFLNEKFGLNEIPRYHIVEMGVNHLTKEREEDHRKDFKTINGSSSFHVAVFTPNCTTFKASPRLCLCDACVVEYSLCELFRSYEIQVQQLNSVNLRQNEP